MTDELIHSLKDLLRDPYGDIRLEDLLRASSAAVAQQLSSQQFTAAVEDLSAAAFAPVWIQQVHDYDTALAPLLEPARLVGSYGLTAHSQAWKSFMAPFSRWAARIDGVPALTRLRGYPALRILYTVTIASVVRENYGPLLGIAVLPRVSSRPASRTSLSDSLVAAIDVRSVVADGIAPIASALAMSDDGTEVTDDLIEGLMRGGGRHTPLSDHLHSTLRPVFTSDIDGDYEWDAAFDRAEILLDALATDVQAQDGNRSFGSPGGFGRYTWRYTHAENPIEKQWLREIEHEGDNWLPVAAGLFGRQSARAEAALSSIAKIAESVRSRQW